MSPILLHINYFEPHCSLEDACKLAKGLGADGVEFRRRRSQVQQSDQDYLDELSFALDRYPLPAVSFGAPGINAMLPDPSKREEEFNAAIKFYEMAVKRFPLSVINLQTGAILNPATSVAGNDYLSHGSGASAEWQWSSATAMLQRLAVFAEQLKLTFGLETHPCYLHDTLTTTNRLIAAVNHPAIGILWDHTNLLLVEPQPLSLESSLEQVRGNLVSVHLKNFLLPPTKGEFAISALSDGIIDIRHQLAQLRQYNYSGPICLESPRLGDRRWFARQDLEYLRVLLCEG